MERERCGMKMPIEKLIRELTREKAASRLANGDTEAKKICLALYSREDTVGIPLVTIPGWSLVALEKGRVAGKRIVEFFAKCDNDIPTALAVLFATNPHDGILTPEQLTQAVMNGEVDMKKIAMHIKQRIPTFDLGPKYDEVPPQEG